MFENQDINKIHKLIFLIGFMGSGKSTLGKNLAETLNYDFIDSDLWIEKEQGISIDSIFSSKGEAFFRELELKFIENLNPFNPTIIATGGGLPCFNGNIEKLKEIGTVIYLKAAPEIIFERIKFDDRRPLLNKQENHEKFDFIQNKLNERTVFYNQAHFIIDAIHSIEIQLTEIKCQLF
jgi:shikimate kinase